MNVIVVLLINDSNTACDLITMKIEDSYFIYDNKGNNDDINGLVTIVLDSNEIDCTAI